MKNITAIRGASALFGAAFIYATFGPLIREMAHMFGDIAQTAVRFGSAGLIVLVILLATRKLRLLPLKHALTALGLGLAGAAITALFTFAVTSPGATIAGCVAAIYAASILTAIGMGHFVFKEKLNIYKIVAIIAALVGLVLYSQALGLLSVGILLALASGIFDGLANVLRKLLKDVDRTLALAYQFGAGTVALSIAMFVSGEQIIREVSLLPTIATVVFSIFQVALNGLLLYGFKRFDVNVGSVILATEIAFATIFGWLLFNEVPGVNEILGAGLIFIGSVVASLDIKSMFKRLKLHFAHKQPS